MFLLDTDTLIYALNGKATVLQSLRENRTEPIAVSVVSYGELVFGAYRSARQEANLAKVHRLAEIYPIIEVTSTVMDTFGQIKASLFDKGQVVDDFDLLIGATALTMNYTVVTNNRKHFQKVPGLHIENWLDQPDQ